MNKKQQTYMHVIGALLNDPQINVVKAKGKGYHKLFPLEREKTIFNGILEIAGSSGGMIDTTVVSEKVARGDMEMFRAVATYLSKCQVSATGSLFDTYIKQLKEAHLRDQFSKLSSWLATNGKSGDINKMLAKVKQTTTYADNLDEEKDFIFGKEISEGYLEALHDDLSCDRSSNILSYGISCMDEVGAVPRKTNLVVIGACPRIGKSLLAVNVARNLVEQGKHVLYYSLEMDRDEIMDRYYSAYAKATYSSIVNRSFKKGELEDFYEVVEKTGHSLALKCNGTLTLDDIDRDLYKLSASNPVDVVIVDYMQMMTDPDSKSIYEAVTKMSNGLKLLAQKHRVLLVSLAQLNREGMKNKPELHHLAQSGAIEQAANIVWLLDKDNQNEMDSDPKRLHILLRKNRSGKGYANLEARIDFDDMTII